MRGFLRRLRPDHLAGQIALLIFAALVLFQLALAAAQRFHTQGSRHPGEPYDSLAAAIVAVDLAPPERRSVALQDLARSLPWSILQLTDAAPSAKAGVDAADDLSEFSDRLWPGARVYLSNDTNARGESSVVVALRQGGYLVAAAEGPRRPGFPAWAANWPTRVQRLALFFLLCVTLLTLWISGTVVAPLVRLAREAERFPDESGPREPLAEAGPREVRDLTRAVNRMQRRIEAMIAARSQALAAISHDLRTILTRIKLRSEFIGDAGLKSKMLADADLMDSMLLKNLQALRDGSPSPDRGPIDLDSVLQTVCDQFADLGHKVSYNGGRHQVILGSLTELQRAFTNLVENAVSHAEEVVVTLSQPSAKLVQVDVSDDGPGIPDADKARVLEPFVRGEPARTVTDRSGFGLGLAIVRSLVDELGGRLELIDRSPHGLIARVTLPRAFAGALASRTESIER
ncbi:MAG: ATP-binding protein [Methylocystis sp.]